MKRELKPKQCPECKKLFQPTRDIQVYCGIECTKIRRRRRNNYLFK